MTTDTSEGFTGGLAFGETLNGVSAMVILRRWFSSDRVPGAVVYARRHIWDIASQSTICEVERGRWVIVQHGFRPWTFTADTVNMDALDGWAAFRVASGILDITS